MPEQPMPAPQEITPPEPVGEEGALRIAATPDAEAAGDGGGERAAWDEDDAAADVAGDLTADPAAGAGDEARDVADENEDAEPPRPLETAPEAPEAPDKPAKSGKSGKSGKAGKGGKGGGKGKSGKAKGEKAAAAELPATEAPAPASGGGPPPDGSSTGSVAIASGTLASRPARLRNVAAITAGVAVAVAVAALVVSLFFRIGSDDALAGARSGALTAARTYSVDIAGYDYRHLSQDFGVVLSHSTPSFRKSFQQSSSALSATLAKYRATATASVVAEGIVSATTSQVVVLVFLDQTVSNSTQKAPTVDRSQLEMTLDASGGGWLIDDVTLL